jgi:hypothetical protein
MTASSRIKSMAPDELIRGLNRAERKALVRCVRWQRPENVMGIGRGYCCLFVMANGMYIGVEKDGYTHT